jgi:hypothetical protein
MYNEGDSINPLSTKKSKTDVTTTTTTIAVQKYGTHKY